MEIVSADSRLLYRGMDIGTAKPSPSERARVPHHLIDVAEPAESWSLAQFRAAASKAIAAIHRRSHLPLLVGGTGQYVRAILEGWTPPPRPVDDSLRKRLASMAERYGHEALHRRLRGIDPERAGAIDARNVRRVVRALEIFFHTGRPASEQVSRNSTSYDVLQIGLTLDRTELFARIDERIHQMLADGWLEEVGRLRSESAGPASPPLTAIGYQELSQHLEGQLSLDEAVRRIRSRTRRFVRQQANWFREDDPNIHWFQAGPGVEREVEALIRSWLTQTVQWNEAHD